MMHCICLWNVNCVFVFYAIIIYLAQGPLKKIWLKQEDSNQYSFTYESRFLLLLPAFSFSKSYI
jgi:hypothetical protein